MRKRVLSILMSLVICVGLAPLPAFADPEGGLLAAGLTAQDGEDVPMVDAEATSADVSVSKGNVSPGGKDWSGSMWSYGVYARAENGWTATVNVKDVSVTTDNVNLWGVDAVASGNTTSHVTVTTGSVTARDLGVKAGANGNSDTTVTVNGNVAAEVEGVLAGSDDDATANVVVNGNVGAGERGIVVRSMASAFPASKATATVKVLGDVTATGSRGVGVSYDMKASKQDVLVTGTISGAQYGVLAELAYDSLPEITSENGLTVWKVTTATGNAGDLFVKRVYNDKWQQEEVVDDDAAKAANYIVRCADDVTPLKADGTALDTSHGYPVAHEGDRVLVTAANGAVVAKAFNGGEEITTKDANGNFYVEVPRGGGIDLSIEVAEDTQYSVVARANADNGDVSAVAGNVTPIRKVNDNAYGVLASAEDGKTATVTVGDIDVNIASADWQYGVAAWAGDNWDTPATSGHVNVTCGNVTCQEVGVEASAEENSDTTVTVNGNVKAGSGYGVSASGRTGSAAKVVVKGNVNAVDTGLLVSAAQEGDASVASACIEVYGDVTAALGSDSSAWGEGVSFQGRIDTHDVLVAGTISGDLCGVATDTYYWPSQGTNNLTVWKVTAKSGEADDLFVKRTGLHTFVVDDDAAMAANYIIKHGDEVTPLAADGSALATSHGYPVAHEGEKVLVTAANGNVVTKAYNNGIEITTKDADGNFYVVVPRGGGIDLTADIGYEPAHDPVAVPVGKTLIYNGKAQMGVEPGAGYTLSGTTSATSAGAYEATATLKAGYKWTDGTTAAKKVPWKIDKAAVKVAIPTGKTLTYNGKAQTGVPAGDGYTLTGASAANAGNYTATAKLKSDANHAYTWKDGTTAAKAVPWKINKANAKVTKALKKIYKVKALKKKAQKFTAVKLATDGKVTYKVTVKKDAKKVLSFKKGKVTVKKGAKKGKYAMKVKVSAKAGKNYNVFKAKTYTIKVTVK